MNQYPEPLLEDEKIYAKIEQLYYDKPKFIYHIIHAFFPSIKIKRVKSFASQNLKNRRCCISDQRLMDLSYASKVLSHSYDGMPSDMLLVQISDKKTMIQQIESELKEAGKPSRVALIGENTDKMMCLQAYNQLYIFIKNKFLEDDKSIKSAIYQEFCRIFKDEINSRFDTSVKYILNDESIKNDFKIFVSERSIAGLEMNYVSIWETVSGREYIKKEESQTQNKSQTSQKYGNSKKSYRRK